MWDIVVVGCAGVAAGALNAVGGGGTFVALPALVLTGMPAVTANAVSRIALLPGAVASAWVYRGDLVPVGTVPTRRLSVVSAAGGAVGALLVLALPASSFAAAVPWLLAFATVVLAVGPRLSRAVDRIRGRPWRVSERTVLIGQFVLAIYGGYFGGAVGILMLAFWAVGLGQDAAVSNPMRITQLAAIYLSAAALFLLGSDALGSWLVLLVMLAGAVAGGWVGAHLARRLPARLLRGIVLTTAVITTVLYFLRS